MILANKPPPKQGKSWKNTTKIVFVLFFRYKKSKPHSFLNSVQPGFYPNYFNKIKMFLPASHNQHLQIWNHLLSTSKTKSYKTMIFISILYSQFWEIHLASQILNLNIFIKHLITFTTILVFYQRYIS